MTGRERPMVALTQSGKGMVRPPISNPKGSRNMQKNSSTSQGALRKNCVTAQDEARKGGSSESCMMPRKAPRNVPEITANKQIEGSTREPHSRRAKTRREARRESGGRYVLYSGVAQAIQ